MNTSKVTLIAFLLTGVAGSVQAGDRVEFPKLKPGEKVIEHDAASIARQLDNELRAKFDAAATNSNHLLTAQAASDASWGFVADHFAEIDRNSDGYASFDEVETFFDARSPIAAVRAKAAAKVQVVE